MERLCSNAILADVAIPFYVSYGQQANVVSIIIPSLYFIASDICYFYVLNNRTHGSNDTAEILADIDMSNLDSNLMYGIVTLTIKTNDTQSKQGILDGKNPVAPPVLTIKPKLLPGTSAVCWPAGRK